MNNNFYIESICENDFASDILDIFKNAGYKYIVKVQDNFLSGWGLSSGKKHIQLIACINSEEVQVIRQDIENDETLSYFNYWRISDKKNILQATRGKSYSIRNDWTRALNKTSKATQEERAEAKQKAYILKDIDFKNVCLGYREKETINNLKKITLEQATSDHLVFKLINKDNDFIEYDFFTKKIVG